MPARWQKPCQGTKEERRRDETLRRRKKLPLQEEIYQDEHQCEPNTSNVIHIALDLLLDPLFASREVGVGIIEAVRASFSPRAISGTLESTTLEL